jgi:hypothetical protein
MPVNWNLFTPVDISGKFQQGWEQGAALREKRDLKSALAAYSANPSDPAAQSALARVSPQFAMKMAEHNWELQQKEAERRRIGALLGPDPSGVPAGINGQPKINFRERQMAALRAGDPAAATALGAMADDQERAEERVQKMSKVTSSFNPITGAETYYDYQGNPVGDDRHPFVRDAQGIVHPHGWTPPTPDAAPAPAPDELAPQPEVAGGPSGSPLDPNLAKPQASAPAAQFTAAAQPGETMEAYLRRRAAEAMANGQDPAQVDQMLNDMLADIGVQP